ncbi:MAG: TetR/AcrR family transcriptional regulator [Candidatus Melainabacteria bacterium]|nr:TetR/AcrR family transcriptional regulator [Candidatus Melainabacteria bacterium]
MQETNLPPPPKSAKAQRTRLKILEAARAIFAERGFAKATAEEISTRAGVGYGTFYLYFTDKRQALHTILSEVDDKLYQVGQTESEKQRLGLGALAPIKATISGFFDSFKENADVLKICHELSATDPDFKAQHDKVRARLVTRIKDHILKGLELGNTRNVDPEIASVAIAGLIETISNEWFFNNRPWDREKVINTVAKLYYSAVIKR